MFQTHCYDAWLGGSARDSRFAMWSHLGGTFPAPLFLFLAGISVALIADRMLQKGAAPGEIGKKVIIRGAQILGLGFLFRLQEYAISWGWAPWSDLFRVDVLNVIGISIMLVGGMCAVVLAAAPEGRTMVAQRFSAEKSATNDASPVGTAESPYVWLIAGALTATIVISALTPLFWTTWRPSFLPWELESYINGVHNLGTPQPWLFPIFPWTGFAFAGLAAGFLLMSDWARERQARTMLLLGVAGAILFGAGLWMDARLPQMYRVYDFWHTSPNFFLARVGVLLGIVLLSYAWCRWGAGQWGFSPLITMGQASLLVYWVHIEFVYGRFSILTKRGASVATASLGLLTIFAAMTLLAFIRMRTKGRGGEIFEWTRRRIGPAQS